MIDEFPADIRHAYQPGLAERLTELGYLGLFQQADEAALNEIWNAPGAPEALECLLAASDAPMLARFLATELLSYRGEAQRLEKYKDALARIYATALAENFTQAANAWTLPGISDGLTGEQLLAIGEPMVPELQKLLSDEQRVYYEGSQEATLGHHYAYRVKDLAAYFIGKIRSIPLALDEDPSKRDAAIEALKKAIE